VAANPLYSGQPSDAGMFPLRQGVEARHRSVTPDAPYTELTSGEVHAVRLTKPSFSDSPPWPGQMLRAMQAGLTPQLDPDRVAKAVRDAMATQGRGPAARAQTVRLRIFLSSAVVALATCYLVVARIVGGDWAPVPLDVAGPIFFGAAGLALVSALALRRHRI